MMMTALLHLTLLLPAAGVAPGVVFHVAPNGTDDGTGAADKPFRTVERAQEEVRRSIALKSAGDITVLLHGGRYELSKPLHFGPEDSGTATRAVVYAASPGEAAILSGGRIISGWSKGPDQQWMAHVPLVREGQWYFRQLFVNGRRAQRARTPNGGFFRIDGPSSQENPFRLKFHGSDLKKAWASGPTASQDDVEVVAMLAWAELRMQIRDVDESARIAVLSGNARPSNRETDAQYYVENAPDGLDAPGEWRLDRKKGIVFYWPLPGEDPATAIFIAPALPSLVHLDGEPASGKLIRNLHFRGLTFSHTDVPLDSKGYADIQAAVAIGGDLRATGAVDCSVDQCVFTHLSGYGIELGRGCKRNAITRNEIFDMGAGGVKIGETTQRQNEADRTVGTTLADNSIHDCGLIFHSAVGVWVGQSSGNVISHNEIRDLFYTGISVGWTWGYGPNQSKDNLVEFNHIHRIGKNLLSDMGGIYTLGVQPGTVLRQNLIHDVSAFTYGGWGIYPDEGSSEILIEKNVVHGCKSSSFRQHYGRENIVRNNIFAFGKENQLMRKVMEDHRSFTLERNIIYWSEGALLGGTWSDDKYKLDHNVYWKPGGGEIRFAEWSFDDWKKRGQDESSVIADPLFMDPARRDFRLRPGSPALERGFQPIDLQAIGPRPVSK